jgi:hypothetical protein
MPEVLDQALYDKVKEEADAKFAAKTGIYKSSWIVREYKKRGGRYKGTPDDDIGLTRWFREKWVDLNRPKNEPGTGYESCGRPSSSSSQKEHKYPLCRPTKRVTPSTPKTVSELSKAAIERAKKSKAKNSHATVKF